MRIRPFAVLVAIVIAAAAFGTRLYAVDRLPIDYDEDDYLRAAQLQGDGLRAGDAGILLRSNYRPEHPPLQKIVFALAVLPLGPRAEIADADTTDAPNQALAPDMVGAARISAVVFASLQAGALALANPLAAAALAVDSYHVKYTSQVMLESLPSLTSLLAVLAYAAYAKGPSRRWRWLAISATCLGLTAAAKYLYCVAGLAIAADALPLEGIARRPDRIVKTIGGWQSSMCGPIRKSNPS